MVPRIVPAAKFGTGSSFPNFRLPIEPRRRSGSGSRWMCLGSNQRRFTISAGVGRNFRRQESNMRSLPAHLMTKMIEFGILLCYNDRNTLGRWPIPTTSRSPHKARGSSMTFLVTFRLRGKSEVQRRKANSMKFDGKGALILYDKDRALLASLTLAELSELSIESLRSRAARNVS